MGWFVYMMRCADGTLYTGMTTDVARREKAHNAGRGAKYTRSRLPVSAVYSRECASKGEALSREAAIKKLTRAEKLELLDAREDGRKAGMNKYEWLESYLLSKPGAAQDYKMEWDWMRYKVGERQFAVRCKPSLKYRGYDNRDLLTLRCEQQHCELLCAKYEDIVPGFYMDKRMWISVFLDGKVPDGELRALCDEAYAIAFSGLTKKAQREILGNAQQG